MALFDVLRMGKCPSCKAIYRWTDREGLKLADARCADCDKPLKRTQRIGTAQVVEVEADWLRAQVPQPTADKVG